MAFYSVSKVRRKLKEILSGIGSGLDVEMGLDYQNPDQKFYQNLTAPYLLIPDPITHDTVLNYNQNNLNSFAIELKLWMPIAAYTDWDGTQLNDLVSDIMSEISDEANFTDCLGPMRHSMTPAEYVHRTPTIVFKKITLEFIGLW
jgi:hypothetical protein